MPHPPPSDTDLSERLAVPGRSLGERETPHREGLNQARSCAETLRARTAAALECFHAAATESGAPHLQVELGEIRVDEKHLRAVEFDLRRGRHKAVVTCKSRGEVTLVGPFQTGKTEGPCRSFPIDADAELRAALGSFLEGFLEEAATP